VVDCRTGKQNRYDAKESLAGHIAPAYRAIKYMTQLSTIAEPANSTKQ
jgi:hypothetical protein